MYKNEVKDTVKLVILRIRKTNIPSSLVEYRFFFYTIVFSSSFISMLIHGRNTNNIIQLSAWKHIA